MPAPKLRPALSEHEHRAAGHVLAAVLSDAFHDRDRAGVAHRKTFAAPCLQRTTSRDVAP